MNLVVLTPEQYKSITDKLDYLITQIESEPTAVKKEWLSAKETMELLGVGQTTLWRYRKDGNITARKINRKLYFKALEVESLIENS